MVEERKPTWPKGRSAPWVGCNIVVGKAPETGRVWLLRERQRVPKADVLHAWDRARPSRALAPDARGWLYAVLKVVEALGRPEVTLDDVYAAEPAFAAQFPANRHVRPRHPRA